MAEAKKAEAVASLMADAARTLMAAEHLLSLGWSDADTKGRVFDASTAVMLAHRAALLAIGDVQE